MRNLKLLIMGLLAALLTFPVVGCENRESSLQEAQERVEEGAEETGDAIEEGVDEAGDELEEAGDSVERAVD